MKLKTWSWSSEQKKEECKTGALIVQQIPIYPCIQGVWSLFQLSVSQKWINGGQQSITVLQGSTGHAHNTLAKQVDGKNEENASVHGGKHVNSHAERSGFHFWGQS